MLSIAASHANRQAADLQVPATTSANNRQDFGLSISHHAILNNITQETYNHLEHSTALQISIHLYLYQPANGFPWAESYAVHLQSDHTRLDCSPTADPARSKHPCPSITRHRSTTRHSHPLAVSFGQHTYANIRCTRTSKSLTLFRFLSRPTTAPLSKHRPRSTTINHTTTSSPTSFILTTARRDITPVATITTITTSASSHTPAKMSSSSRPFSTASPVHPNYLPKLHKSGRMEKKL